MESELIGVEEMKAALKDLDKKMSRKIMAKALRAGEKIIRKACVSFAPVATGQTKDAIKVKSGKRKKDSVSVLVTIGKAMFKGATFYAGFLNYGWKWKPHKSARFRTGGDQDEKQIPGTHWLEKSFESSKAEAVRVVEETLKDGLDEAIAESKAKK